MIREAIYPAVTKLPTNIYEANILRESTIDNAAD